jgi:hypothetical protein
VFTRSTATGSVSRIDGIEGRKDMWLMVAVTSLECA